MKKWVRASVVIIFYGWLCSSLAVVPKIEIGLDQEISMPDDSFVLKYFNFLNEYLSVGKFNTTGWPKKSGMISYKCSERNEQRLKKKLFLRHKIAFCAFFCQLQNENCFLKQVFPIY